MSTKLKVLPVNCGDSLLLTHKSNDKKVRNIVIDGGYIKAFKTLKKQIKSIQQRKQLIDLWVLTHLDADHINGALQYLRKIDASEKPKIIGRFWFNFFDAFTISDDSPFLSFGKGFDLSKLLRKLSIRGRMDITNELGPISIGDATITILSPDKKTFRSLQKAWKDEFKIYYGGEPSTLLADPSLKDARQIEDLAKKTDAKEGSSKSGLVNRSSIAFMYEERGKRILMLGDAYPSVILDALRKDYSKKKPLKVKYMKLSHHGSRKNYHTELLDIISCRRFIISADGENQHGLPDKEVLAKILNHPNRDRSKRITFYFNHDDDRFHHLFDADKDAERRYNFTCKFPKLKKVLKVKL
ncbi:Metallo-beta-lactamase superfamily protein [Dyadobacter soli]|uniref:Metallo-beta-lactamase superfamily protein n=1 Tax=Dyadobacter soli TaxID=659014 RepID=A0A1G7T6J5_9BACT|nr:MBL fold metallo-hydrolase [Dyadobacter soli]SDG30851.1 Metallo-beta-lactamase superfamily protein [Dyadobacter soli]